MKFLISYFYQIRFFKQNMIPISTSIGDPKWYKGELHKDKRGIWIGLNDSRFHPPIDCECPNCVDKDPSKCSFSKNYYEAISKLNINEIISSYESLSKKLNVESPTIVLIVHEDPTNPCSERWSLIKWFSENGVELKEFTKDE